MQSLHVSSVEASKFHSEKAFETLCPPKTPFMLTSQNNERWGIGYTGECTATVDKAACCCKHSWILPAHGRRPASLAMLRLLNRVLVLWNVLFKHQGHPEKGEIDKLDGP